MEECIKVSQIFSPPDSNVIQEPLCVIKERLYAWGSDDEWLPQNTAENIRTLIQRFYYYYGKNPIIEMGLTGWECGLGQMLNTLDERIVAILPYLLTAYMYNFRGSKYISDFITKTKPPTWKASLDDDSFLGICKNTQFVNAIGSSSGSVYGIGKFLSSTLPTGGQYADKVVDDIAHLFFFPAVSIEELPEIYAMTTYIVPENKLGAFQNRIRTAMKSGRGRYRDIEDNEEIRRIVYSELKKDGEPPLPEYRRDVYESIFVCCYQVVKSAFLPKNMKSKSYLPCPPDAKLSFELLQTSLRRISPDSLSAISNAEIEQYLDSEFQYCFSKRNKNNF